VEIETGLTLAKTCAPRQTIDRTLADAPYAAHMVVTVLSLGRPRRRLHRSNVDTTVHSSDVLIVAGSTRDLDAFTDLGPEAYGHRDITQSTLCPRAANEPVRWRGCYPPTWMPGRRSGSGSFLGMISRTTGAVSPRPRRK
jgi:hypothetical protein